MTRPEDHRDTKQLVGRLMAIGSWKGIAAVTRSGLVPATILAREMEIRFVDTLCIAACDEQRSGPVEVIKTPDLARAEEGDGMEPWEK